MMLCLYSPLLSFQYFILRLQAYGGRTKSKGFSKARSWPSCGWCDCINHCRVFFVTFRIFNMASYMCDCCFAAGVVFSDSKQVVVVFLVSLVVLLITKLKNPGGIAVLSNYNCGCWIRVLGCTIFVCYII